MIEMIDMMSALTELHTMRDKGYRTVTGDFVDSNLALALRQADSDIKEAGALVEGYRKARPLHRVLHVNKWAERFQAAAENFHKTKSKIQFSLNIHTTVSIETKLDQVIDFMQDLFHDPQAFEERRLTSLVSQDKSQKYLESKIEFKKFYLKSGLSRESGRESASSTFAEKWSDGAKYREREAEEAWEEAKKPLETILPESRSAFEDLLKVQTEDLTRTIQQSETTIIRAINEGPHIHINHPEIRNLWKAMQWRLSVKTRHFVMALHDHYFHGTHSTSHGDSTADIEPSSGNGSQGEPRIDRTDKWCLQYLRIRYLPAISEAFDDDGSGFIRISEVNEFTEGIPKGWNLLKWVAYWTASWPKELMRYSSLIQETILQLQVEQCKVKPENVQYVNDYMNGFAFSEVKLLVNSVQSQGNASSGSPELHSLASEMSSQTEKYLRSNLDTVKYNIDDPDKLPLLCGPGRIEKYLFPLLYLLLERHLRIVDFASKHALDSREMDEASSTLYQVLQKVWDRVQELKESFRQQKLNVSEHFKSFSCGIYSRYHYSDASKGIGLMLQRSPGVEEAENVDVSEGDRGSASDAESGKPSRQSSSVVSTIQQPNDNNTKGQCQIVPADQEDAIPIEYTRDTIADTSEALLSSPEIYPNVINDSSFQPASLLGVEEHGTSYSEVTENNEIYKITGDDPTRFGPFSLKTSLYLDASPLTEDTAPWRPLRRAYSAVGPREMFRMAIQHVQGRLRLLSPPLSWDYLKRRRSIRLRWIELSFRAYKENIGGREYKDWEPSTEDELADLAAQVTPADVECYELLVQREVRRRSVHLYRYGDGCFAIISGKRFACLECDDFDLCEACEHAESHQYNLESHLRSHTMLQYAYPVDGWFLHAVFRTQGRKHLIKHSKQSCPCSSTEIMESGRTIPNVLCRGCQKEIKNEVHFRCIQCSDYDLCEACEKDPPLGHCKAHVLLKLRAPFQETEDEEGSEDTDDEDPALSVDVRLDRLTRRLSRLETKFGGRLGEMQKSFTQMDGLQSRLDEMQTGFTRLEEMQKEFTRAVSLLEHMNTQEKRWSYLYGSTKSAAC